MIRYPLQFAFHSEAGPGRAERWSAVASEGGNATCAVPPEFDGPGGGFSPEDFFGLALLNCFVATFKVIAEASRAEFGSLSASGKLTVDRDEQGQPWMKRFEIEAQVSLGPTGDRSRIERVLEKTSRSCLVANSVRTEVAFSFQVS